MTVDNNTLIDPSTRLLHINTQERYKLSMHLQWFAAEDEGRTFDPTEQKIRKAREEGRVAKTQEIPASLLTLLVVILLWVIGSLFVRNLSDIMQSYFGRLYLLEKNSFENEGIQFTFFILRVLWPVFTTAMVVAILGNVVQFGWAPSIKPITPDISKVSFKFNKWIEKIISVQGWYNTGMSVVKILIVSSVIVVNIYLQQDKILSTVSIPFKESMIFMVKISFSIIIEVSIVLLGLAILDYVFQRSLFMEQLKMSFQDIKEEFKESEGNPEIKKRIQSRMQELLNINLPQTISDSDVLVTNPTHFAVAMKYDSDDMDAPVVTAKGEDEIALRMRRLAREREIPIIENKPLARALYADLEIGDVIPEKYYEAVSLIFREVYNMKGSILNE